MTKQEQPAPIGRPVPITRDDITPGMWSYKHTFRHGQCDPAGIVYTPEFFNVFNHAVEDWFCNHLGINYYDVLGARRIGLGYVNASATFFTPCMMGDEVEIFVTISKIGGKSYQLCLHAMKGDNEALRGYFTTVITCLEKHRPTEMPDDIREAMKKYKAGT